MNTKLKICGMKYPDNIREVLGLNPDYLGFIFYEKSKRYVGTTIFEEIKNISPQKKIAVFVNETKENILQIAGKGQFQILQLHGEESPQFCYELHDEKSFILIKAFSIDENFDFKQLNAYKSVVNYFLFDTKGKDFGGNGISFDWNILKKYDNEIRFFLSGGISLDNIADLLDFISKNNFNIQAIDVNSRLEIEPGLKDIQKLVLLQQKIKSFVANQPTFHQ